MNTGFIGAQLRKWTDHDLGGSVATRCRRRRLALFTALLDELPRPLKILDIGGEAGFWNAVPENTLNGVEVTLLNLVFPSETGAGFIRVLGDARHIPFVSNREFDVVFSNSVLEHLGTLEDQGRMAAEVRRVGRRYFVQTPSKWFILEPHFLVPAFQFLPLSWRVWIASHYGGGWYCRPGNRTAARKEVESIRLLTERECRRLFPGATLRIERLLGMTKSYMIIGGWPLV